MQKEFDENMLSLFANQLSLASLEIKYTGDVSDFGNEIGYQLLNLYHSWSEEDTNLFIQGIKHGIDLRRREISQMKL